MEIRRVGDLEHQGVVTEPSDASAYTVAESLHDNDIAAIVIVNEKGKAVGVISQIDLVKLYGKNLHKIFASEIMTKDIVTISEEISVEKAAELMISRNIHRIFVLDEKNRPYAVLSVTDIIRDMINTE